MAMCACFGERGKLTSYWGTNNDRKGNNGARGLSIPGVDEKGWKQKDVYKVKLDRH